jgi:hypothetical protein
VIAVLLNPVSLSGSPGFPLCSIYLLWYVLFIDISKDSEDVSVGACSYKCVYSEITGAFLNVTSLTVCKSKVDSYTLNSVGCWRF